MRKLAVHIAFAVFQTLWFAPAYAFTDPWSECESDCGFFKLDVGIDFIYWKPCIDDLDYAMKSCDISNTSAAAPLDPLDGPVVGKYHYLDPRGAGGVKARIGKRSLWNGWDVFCSYTYFGSAAARSVLQSPSGHAWPTLMHGQQMFAGNSVCAKYRLHYQAFDALLLYPYECQPCSFIVPFFGFDSLFLFQELKSNSTDVVDAIIGKSKWRSNLHGCGLKVGMVYNFGITEQMGVYTKISGSILAAEDHAHFKSERDNIDPGINLIVSDGFLKLSSREDLIVPGFTLALGAYYRMESEGFNMEVHMGYEFVQWFNMPSQRRFPAKGNGIARHYSSSLTELGLHGVTTGFDVGF